MATEISNKSTKNEILEAYEALLKEAKEQKREAPQKIQEEQQNKQIVKKSGDLSNEQIIKDVAGLKINISASLDALVMAYEEVKRRVKSKASAEAVNAVMKRCRQSGNRQDIYYGGRQLDPTTADLMRGGIRW